LLHLFRLFFGSPVFSGPFAVWLLPSSALFLPLPLPLPSLLLLFLLLLLPDFK
jgi:hypothetical protein